MADLLRAELELSSLGLDSSTRVLGRTIVELWLNANEFLLDPESAIARLELEHVTVHAQIQHGFAEIWERLERQREGGIDLRDPEFERGEGQRANVENLARRVATLREKRGLGGGAVAHIQYQMVYRRDSIEDVHVTMDHLFRYLLPEGGVLQLLRIPGPEDTNEFRGPHSVRQDAQLLADILGVYLEVSGQGDQLDDLKEFVGSPVE
jgi:hypothetical protein